MSFDVDALIVGAGPTGLTLAIELLKHGLKVQIIDALAHPTDQSRALGVHSRTLEVFDRMGLAEKMIQRGLPLTSFQFSSDGHLLGQVSLEPLNCKFPFILILPQSETEAVLNEELERLGGKVQRPCICTHAEQGKATIDGKTIQARWIFGCDGAHSTVRHSLGVSFQGAKFTEVFALSDVEIEESQKHEHFQVQINKTGLAAVIPLPKAHHYRLISTPPQEFPLKIKKTLWSSHFQVHRRIVPKMRHGSLFLLGDAAHVHSPMGGQGLNISVQDAYNLAWKVALVHQNKAPDSLLHTFDEERHPVAKHTLKATTLGTFFITLQNRSVRKFFFAVMGLLLRQPFFKKRFAYSLSELASHCKWSSIVSQPWRDVFWKGPQPGTRFPEAPASLRHVLLVYGAPTFSFSHPEIELQHRPLDSYFSVPCFYLIRPDGVVGWRSRRLDSQRLAGYLLSAYRWAKEKL